MKNRKMFLAAAAAIGAIALGAGAFAQDQDQNANMTPTPTGLSASDQIFIMDLLHANAREIAMSRIAYHNAFHHGLSNFAREMIDDHSKLEDQLVSTYGNMEFARNWPTALHMRGEHWDRGDRDEYYYDEPTNQSFDIWNYLYTTDWNDIHQLRNMNGYGLDWDYIQAMVTDHHQLLEKIWREKRTTQNSDIQNLISQIEPQVEDHYEKAQGLSFAYEDPMNVKVNNPWMR